MVELGGLHKNAAGLPLQLTTCKNKVSQLGAHQVILTVTEKPIFLSPC